MHLTTLLALAASLLGSAAAVPAEAAVTPLIIGDRACGTIETPAEIAYDTDDQFSIAAVPNPAPVKVYAHVVTTRAKQGRFTRNQVRRQLVIMNNAYNPHGITFRLQNISFTTNDIYATGDATTFLPAKRMLRRGSYADLNLYFVSDLGNNLLGYCYFPTADAPRGSLNFIRDGCVNLAESLPGGAAQEYNMGGTATHETGHWFGLFHVFQDNDCASEGDLVNDTPRQRNATQGCPTGRQDTCPGRPGVDSIHNFMDYSVDRCYESFTAGQARRMKSMYQRFRAGK